MSQINHIRRAPRIGVAALLCLGTLALAPATTAHAEPGNGAGQGQQPTSSGDPAGNNGTVKIAPLGDVDTIPNNTPHVGCTFQVEWYGFDEGADIVSTVSFQEQAPTTGVGMTVGGPAQVAVGGDAATGAGTPTGFDGRADYTLSFTGEPHPQQGYHVKLTIATPGSIGNDTKSKVFWVEGCAPTTPPTTPPTAPPSTPPSVAPQAPTTANTPNNPNTPDNPQAPEVLPETSAPEVLPETSAPEVLPESSAPEVLGVQAFGGSDVQGQQQLPTAVHAGAVADSTTGTSTATVLLGLLMVLLGGVCARLGWIRARG